MKTIHKFTFGHVCGGPQQHRMARDAIVRHFAMQNGKPTMWAELDDQLPQVVKSFRIIGTGHPINATDVYLGTCQDGEYVWHLFQVFASR